MLIRPAANEDANAIWAIMEPIIRAGETYTLPRDMDKKDRLAYWLSPEHEVFVAEENGEIVGTYFRQANQQGGGAHVANCGYMTAVTATGPRGRTRDVRAFTGPALAGADFKRCSFNFVISTNERAVRLWQSFGFDIVGRLPAAFQHPTLGYVDAYIMYRDL